MIVYLDKSTMIATHSVLHDIYYNTGNLGRYMVEMQSQMKYSGIILPVVCGVGKRLDLHVPPEKPKIRPIVSEAKEVSQMKPRLRQGSGRIKMQNKYSD